MRTKVVYAVLAFFVPGICSPSLGDPPDDQLWVLARECLARGEYDCAVQIYSTILTEDPSNQRATVQLGVALFGRGDRWAAVTQLEQGVALRSFTDWEAKGLCYLAEVCFTVGCDSVVQDAVSVLRARYPDSLWTTRAEVVEARLTGGDVEGAEAALAEEESAEQAYQQVFEDIYQVGTDQEIMAAFEDVAARYPMTRTALAAERSRLMVLTREQAQSDQAIAGIEAFLGGFAGQYPRSKLIVELRQALAGLYQRCGRPRDAFERYMELAELADSPEIACEAHMQALGANMEAVLQRASERLAVADWEWEEVRNLCFDFLQRPQATPGQRSRADLTIMESYFWQKRFWEADREASLYLDTYNESVDRSGVGTAHLIAGESLMVAGRYEEALVHFEWVAQRFGKGSEDIWPGVSTYQVGRRACQASVARAYYRIYDLYIRGGLGSREEIRRVGEYVLQEFPNTRYADLVAASIHQHGY